MTLGFLRSEFVAESLIERLTASAPPVTRTVQESGGRYEILEDMEPADRNGRNLSAAMVTLIGSITAEMNFYAPRFPIRRALSEWERICRRRHRGGLWWDHANEPICGLMVRDIVEGGASVLWCSDRYGISYPRADRLIGAGATFVSDRLAKWDDERLGITHDPKTCDICWRSAHETA